MLVQYLCLERALLLDPGMHFAAGCTLFGGVPIEALTVLFHVTSQWRQSGPGIGPSMTSWVVCCQWEETSADTTHMKPADSFTALYNSYADPIVYCQKLSYFS